MFQIRWKNASPYCWQATTDGETYDLLLHPDYSTCSCPGWSFSEGCVHLHAAKLLVDAAVPMVTGAPVLDVMAVDPFACVEE